MVIEQDKLIQAIADRLELVHFDGNGCGTHTGSACSTCFGPSPMSAQEVAIEVAVLIIQMQEG